MLKDVTKHAIAVRANDVQLLVEISDVTVAGTEPTSVLGETAKKVIGAFDQAEEAIVSVAVTVAGSLSRMADQARPDRLEVEFGLRFSAHGDVVVAAASGEATLRVLMGYDRLGQGRPS
jgi:hypothetical protein